MMGFEGLTGELSTPAWVVVMGFVGMAVGSFLNVVILRWPLPGELAGERPLGLLRPRSHCPACKTPIRAWQNIPVLSFLLLRGQCRHCGVRIGLRYPLVEGLSGLLSAVVIGVLGPDLAGAGRPAAHLGVDHPQRYRYRPPIAARSPGVVRIVAWPGGQPGPCVCPPRPMPFSVRSSATWSCGRFTRCSGGSPARRGWAMVISSCWH